MPLRHGRHEVRSSRSTDGGPRKRIGPWRRAGAKPSQPDRDRSPAPIFGARTATAKTASMSWSSGSDRPRSRDESRIPVASSAGAVMLIDGPAGRLNCRAADPDSPTWAKVRATSVRLPTTHSSNLMRRPVTPPL
jgi:hypothetical protein